MTRNLIAVLVLAICVMLSVKALAQRPVADRDYEDDRGSLMNAGGNWTVDQSEDRMTAEKRSRFELQSNDTEGGDARAKVILYCADGKLKLADFNPNLRLSRPNWAGFWGQPQMHVRVRADNSHDEHNWNWINGHFLAMDKGTARELIGAELFRIEFNTPDGRRVAEFSPSGLDLRLVRDACGMTAKKQ
ncbi:MAG TPA: hypothetical protein VL156_01250 [Terriglobales bacterium]|nr:hypothetical protein [Terriglobales bacterium]